MENEMKHPRADLIKAWAENTSIRFVCPEYYSGEEYATATMVIDNPHFNWTIYKPAPTNGAVIMPCGTVVTNVQEAYIAGQKAARKYYVDKPEDTIAKVTKWLWANESGLISPRLYSEDERGYDSEYNIKLEWSATEFEVTE